MRRVIVHLWGTTESAVAGILSAAYPRSSGPTWVAYVGDDPCLYIDIYRHGPVEYPDWATRFDCVGGHPAVSGSADISGRHNGWRQVEEFVGMLLGRFRGLAEDDDSHRLGSLAEVCGEHRVGQRFGEYWRGWVRPPHDGRTRTSRCNGPAGPNGPCDPTPLITRPAVEC